MCPCRAKGLARPKIFVTLNCFSLTTKFFVDRRLNAMNVSHSRGVLLIFRSNFHVIQINVTELVLERLTFDIVACKCNFSNLSLYTIVIIYMVEI